MPRRDDIHKVLIIGSGPIVIGQACEFDYSGTQACKALRSLGYEVVLVNSNPATIMTDPGMADATYIEPLNAKVITEIIAKERPDALLPNLGGQTGLNLSSELHQLGVLEEYGVKIIGVNIDAIQRGEDRLIFKETMDRLGIDMAGESDRQYRGGCRTRGGRIGFSGGYPAGVHHGRHRRRPGLQSRRTAHGRSPRTGGQPGQPGAGGGIRPGLGRTGTGGGTGCQKSDHHGLLY